MKKLLALTKPLPLAAMSLLVVSIFFRYYLLVNSSQLIKEFKNQNHREIYRLDTLAISARLNSLSAVINWVCIEGSISNQIFYKMEKGSCKTGLFQQQQQIHIPEANNTKFIFTLRLPKEAEGFFALFWLMQIFLIIALIISTKKSEEEKRSHEIQINKLARQMSHDIRAPLATLNTILDSLHGHSKQDFILLQSSIQRITDISNSLLKKSKDLKISYLHPPILSSVNLYQSINEIFLETKVLHERNSHIEISLFCDESALDFLSLVDEIEFKRSISNLINNAIEAFNKSRLHLKVHISLVAKNEQLTICIADNGIGIPPEILSKLGQFELSTKKYGNGLGVIHSFESIRSWRGEINITSKNGEGTTVTILLPRLARKRMLILLDNDELVRLTWQNKAKKSNVELVVFSSPIQLFSNLTNFSLDTIFYIDSDLDNEEKGENIAKTLFDKGYTSLNICSGHDKKYFSHLSFIQEVVDKKPPF